MCDKKYARNHSILDRGLNNAKKLSFSNSFLLRFCFLLDFFQMNDFFDKYEHENPTFYNANHKVEGYDHKRSVNQYKKRFFNDSLRTSNANNMSATLQDFWDFFIKLLIEPTFKDSLQNSIQERVLFILKEKINSSECSLIDLIKDYDSFIAFISHEITECDEYVSAYFDEVERQESMSEIYEDYSPHEVPFPEKLLFEELYSYEIEKYDIYNSLIRRSPTASSFPSYFSFSESTVNEKASFWNLILENWEILLLFYNNYHIWSKYVENLIFPVDMKTVQETNFDNLSKDLLNTTNIPFDDIMKRTETYYYILNYNFSPRKRKVNEIFNMIKKRITSYKLSLFVNFCFENEYYIQNLDIASIKYLYRLFIFHQDWQA